MPRLLLTAALFCVILRSCSAVLLCSYAKTPSLCRSSSPSCFWSAQTQSCLTRHTSEVCETDMRVASDLKKGENTRNRISVCEAELFCEIDSASGHCIPDRLNACHRFLNRDLCATHPGCTWIGAVQQCFPHGRSSAQTVCGFMSTSQDLCEDQVFVQDCVWNHTTRECQVRPTDDFVSQTWIKYCATHPEGDGCFGDRPVPDFSCPRLRNRELCKSDPLCSLDSMGNCASKVDTKQEHSSALVGWIMAVCALVVFTCCFTFTVFKA
jgi:hypothetical protein